MFIKYSIMTRIYAESLMNQDVDNFVSSRFRESRRQRELLYSGDGKENSGVDARCDPEWLYRLLQNSKRFWKRYTVSNSKFMRYIIKKDKMRFSKERK